MLYPEVKQNTDAAAHKVSEAIMDRHLTVAEMLRHYLTHLVCKRKDSVESQLKPVFRLMGHLSAVEVKGIDLTLYRQKRQEEGVCHSTVNRALTYFKAAFHRAIDDEIVERMPKFRFVKETNVRQGFVAIQTLDILFLNLRPVVADAIALMFHTGWRKNSVLFLKWEHVDWDRKILTLPPELSKTKKPVPYPMVGPIFEILERRYQQKNGEWIFHWGNGDRVKRPDRNWKKAKEAAGVPGLYLHDLRRSMANLHLQVGIPQAVTMKLAGWASDSMYRRYLIFEQKPFERELQKAEDHLKRLRALDDDPDGAPPSELVA